MSLQDYDLKKISIFLIGLLIVILALAGTGTSIYFYSKYKKTQDQLRLAGVSGQTDVEAIIDKVGKLIKLPEGETPQVATIADLSKLQNQPFFAKAKVGDKVLLFIQAKRAVLYDPLENIVLEVGPLVLPSGSPFPTIPGQVAGSESAALNNQSAGIKVAIYNGTNSSGLAITFADELKKKIPEIEIVDSTNAVNKSYAKTVIIDISGAKLDQLENVAQAAGAEKSALPSGEKKPQDADFLIILGEDKATPI